MKKIAGFIVAFRNIFLLLFVGIAIFCVWGMTQASVEYDISKYLSEETDTRQAIDIMADEFPSFGMSQILIRNISFEKADALADEIKELKGVKSLTFENKTDYYKDSCALFDISFEGTSDDEESEAAYHKIQEMLAPYDAMYASELDESFADVLSEEVGYVMILAAAIILAVLLFTSKSFADVIVFLFTFAMAALLNLGTNFLLGPISYISNTVCTILQLALAIDYAIIFSHRFAEEKEKGKDNLLALTDSLAKSIVEVSSSSLTTIAGLFALTTMSFKLGADLGFVLAKSILCSMATVFLFMPGIMMACSKIIDKTKHKNLVPRIDFVGKAVVKLRYVILAVFVCAVGAATYFSFNVDYSYNPSSISTSRPATTTIAKREVEKIFGYNSQFVILMKGRDYDRQREVLNMVEAHSDIKSAMGIANIEIERNGVKYYLTDKINYKEFSQLLSASNSIGDAVYTAYASFSKDTMEDSLRETALYEMNKDIYRVSLIDLFDCAVSQDDFILAYIGDDDDLKDTYENIRDLIGEAEDQLVGENYSRLVFAMDCPVEGEKTFSLIKTLYDEVKKDYPEAIFAGDSMSAYDMNESFSSDNIKVSLFTILFVFLILLFTFSSFALPAILTITIQGAIFINFSYYFITGTNVFFFVYLLICAIQMGATIDYAIVMTNRFNDLKEVVGKKEAVITAVSDAFPTIITSGLIMSAAGALIGMFVSEPLISTMGICLSRGVIVSIICVMIVLPALLYVGDWLISKTKFKFNLLSIFKKIGSEIKKAGKKVNVKNAQGGLSESTPAQNEALNKRSEQ